MVATGNKAPEKSICGMISGARRSVAWRVVAAKDETISPKPTPHIPERTSVSRSGP